MFENLQSKLRNRNKSWDTIAYMTVVFKVGNENTMVFFYAATLSAPHFIPGDPEVS
jgi:hypothetical protein